MNYEQLTMKREEMKNEEGRVKNGRRGGKLWRSGMFCAFFIFTFSFFSCQSPLELPQSENPASANTGSFSLALNEGQTGRTILPTTAQSNFAAYALAFAATSGGEAKDVDRTNTNLADAVELVVGTYTLTVTAYTDAGKTKPAAQGSLAGIVIGAGAAVSRSVTLTATIKDGTGTFSWNITLPSGVTAAAMKIAPASAGGTAEQTVNLMTETTKTRTLNSGQYNITFNLEKGDGSVVWKEILHVYQNLESAHSFTFTDNHFINPHYTVTYDSVTGNQSQSVLHGDKLIRPNDPTSPGYEFMGWYTDAAFTKDYDFNDHVIESFTLYAWMLAFEYTITGSGEAFTADRGFVRTIGIGAANDTLANVLAAIRTNANGNAAHIRFGDGSSTLDIGAAYIEFNNTWGALTLSGKITSNNSTNTQGTILISAGTVTSTADIANTNTSTNSRAIYKSGGTLTISAGTVETTAGYAIQNIYGSSTNSTVTISGGTVKATSGRAISNSGNETYTEVITISGGTVEATTGDAIYNSNCFVNISSGTVKTTTGVAVNSGYQGGVRVSGGTVTSANTTATSGTINIGQNLINSTTITGGTVENTAGGNAVYNTYSNEITLGGSPVITGAIVRTQTSALNITGTPAFNPGSNKYTISLPTYTAGAVAVTGSATTPAGTYVGNFIVKSPLWELETSDNNLVCKLRNLPNYTYIITGSGTSFTAVRGALTVGTGTIQQVIDAIREEASNATIQFGNGSNVLDIGTASAQFTGDWGGITLTGKITSTHNTANEGTVLVAAGVSITSTADIANTRDSCPAVVKLGAGTVTISGGTVSATSGSALSTTSSSNTAVIIINGNATVKSNTGRAVHRYSSGSTTIADTATVTSASTGETINLYNSSITITGGTVSNTSSGVAVNGDNSSITVSGGTISAGTGVAISVSSQAVTVSGATITSANTTYGTIYKQYAGNITITDSTVTNTAGGNAVYAGTGNTVLRGNTVITGALCHPATGGNVYITGTPAFTPGNRMYTLRYAAAPAVGRAAVTGEAANQASTSNFTLHSDHAGLKLAVSGNNLVIANE